jgi:hypothetical protein
MATRQGGRAVALNFPSWMNTVVFPGGFKDPKIQKEYQTMSLRDFLQEYGAQPLSAEGCIFEPEIVDQCCVIDEWEEPIPTAEYASGFDIGIKRDSSVHTIVRAPLGFANSSKAAKVVFVRRMHKMPIEAQLALVLQDQERYGIQTVYTDGTGMGEPIVQQARNLGIFVRSVVFTKASKMPMVINLRGLLERRKIRLPTAMLCPALRDQLLTYEWNSTGTTANAPSGFHDDYVCSLALACKFFPASGTDGEGQVFHANSAQSIDKRPRARESSSIEVKRIRVAPANDTPNVFTTGKRGSSGLRWNNGEVD